MAKGKKNGPSSSAAPAAPPQLSPEEQQATRRLATQHSVLKQQFADVSVDCAIVKAEHNLLAQRLAAAQQMIEKLTADDAATRKVNEEQVTIIEKLTADLAEVRKAVDEQSEDKEPEAK